MRRGALLLALLLFSASCRRREETRFLNFDPETTAGQLLTGWSGWEKTPEGDTFVWAAAPVAKLKVTNAGGSDRVLRFRAWAFSWPGAPEQAVTLFVNGARVDGAGLDATPRVVTFVVPGALWKKGENEVRFTFAYAASPRDHVPGGDDARTLAAAFDWLEILPPPSSLLPG